MIKASVDDSLSIHELKENWAIYRYVLAGIKVVINHDQLGDIGVLTTFQIHELLNGVEPQDIKTGPYNLLKAGEADMSVPTTGCKMVIPTDTGRLYVAITRQVENMLTKWPEKKAALWTPKMWGIEFMEAVFDVTGISCTGIGDMNREWRSNQLAGYMLKIITGLREGSDLRIVYHSKNDYAVQLVSEKLPDYGDWHDEPCSNYANFPSSRGLYTSWSFSSGSYGAGKVRSPQFDGTGITGFYAYVKCKITKYGSQGWISGGVSIGIGNKQATLTIYPAGQLLSSEKLAEYGLTYWTWVNTDFPNFTKIGLSGFSSLVGMITAWGSVSNDNSSGGTSWAEISPIVVTRGGCITDGIEIGDKYMILDPIRREYLLDDNALPILDQEYWRASSGIGDAITTTPVQYYWDGTGTVFLTSHPRRISPIMYDNELRVEVQNGTDLRVRDYAPGAEVIKHDGFHVSRDTPDITSLFRPGINTVTISVRDANAGKVGYCTPVYVKRRK